VRVEAKTRTRLHKIEVEDEASAFLEYENGAWGYYYTSTCEGCGGLHLELAGDKGKLVLEGGKLRLYKFSQPVSEFSVSSEDMWASPEVKEEEVALPSDIAVGHSVIIENFARAIAHGEPLIAPGEDGLKSVEFINALILSGRKGKRVEIPVNRKEYDGFIEEMKKTSKPKEVVNVKRITDPRASKS
jgi:predicted dehydrogenase